MSRRPALDVTIPSADLERLMVELQHELGMAVLLITHDLGVVANVAEEIVVMYRGEVMESGTLEEHLPAGPNTPTSRRCCARCPAST